MPPRIYIGKKGSAHGRSKLTEAQVLRIRKTYKRWRITYRELAIKYKVSTTCIQSIISGKLWRHIDCTVPGWNVYLNNEQRKRGKWGIPSSFSDHASGISIC